MDEMPEPMKPERPVSVALEIVRIIAMVLIIGMCCWGAVTVLER